jgi:hypothetical protein
MNTKMAGKLRERTQRTRDPTAIILAGPSMVSLIKKEAEMPFTEIVPYVNLVGYLGGGRDDMGPVPEDHDPAARRCCCCP